MKKAFNIKDFLINYGVIMIIIVLVVFTGIKSPNFLSQSGRIHGNQITQLLVPVQPGQPAP